jgi:hypothetical protein
LSEDPGEPCARGLSRLPGEDHRLSVRRGHVEELLRGRTAWPAATLL